MFSFVFIVGEGVRQRRNTYCWWSAPR